MSPTNSLWARVLRIKEHSYERMLSCRLYYGSCRCHRPVSRKNWGEIYALMHPLYILRSISIVVQMRLHKPPLTNPTLNRILAHNRRMCLGWSARRQDVGSGSFTRRWQRRKFEHRSQSRRQRANCPTPSAHRQTTTSVYADGCD